MWKLEKVDKSNKTALCRFIAGAASVHAAEETPVGQAFTDAWNVWDSMGRAPVAEQQGFDGCSSTRAECQSG